MLNNDMQKATLNCKTISPVHIGSGEILSKFEYYIKDNKVYVINQNKLIDLLKNKSIKANQANKKITTKKQSINKGFDCLKNNAEIKVKEDFLNDYQNYISSKETAVNLQNFLDNTLKLKEDEIESLLTDKYYEFEFFEKNNLDIQLMTTTINKTYIPGSSIKGAVWTAILYNYFNSNKALDINSINDEMIQKIQKEFGRFLMIEDVILTENSTIIIKPDLKQEIPKEMIKPDTEFGINITIKSKLLERYLKTPGNDKDAPFKSINDIQEALNSFYNKTVWNYEKENITSNEFLKAFYNEKITTPLLRIGGGSSCIAVSLYLLFNQEKRKQLKNSIQTKNKHNKAEFPIERKAIKYKDTTYPFGWIECVFSMKEKT